MEHQQQLVNAAILLQKSIAREKATINGRRPPASGSGQDSDVRKNPPKIDGLDCGGEIEIMETSSRHPSGSVITWQAENASLEDEFSALKTSLSTHLDLETHIFHDLGRDEAKDIDTESACSEGAHDRGLVLSEAVRYIQHLEELHRHLVEEKSALENKVSGWEKRSSEVGATI